MAKGLTTRQKQIWSRKLQGLKRHEIAQELGIDAGTVGNAITTIRKKLKAMGKDPDLKHGKSMEIQNPEIVAAGIEAASDPLSKTQKDALDKVNAQLKAAGVEARVSQTLLRRIRVRYGDTVNLNKNLTVQQMVKQLDENIDLINAFIDPTVVAAANLKDLAYAKSVLIDKRQLLSGAPTQIISDAERKDLVELIPMLLAEGERRGITIDVTPTKVNAQSK